MTDSPRGRLPSVHEVMQKLELDRIEPGLTRVSIRDAVREVIEEVRSRWLVDPDVEVEIDHIASLARGRLLMEVRGRLRPVLNATGILIHTGLGRAPLAAEAIERVRQVASGYCDLELDLESGGRGHRSARISTLMTRLSGAEAATVVNNNAAATVLTLRALAQGREVVVSRGQLVEIGGSFRLPEVFEASGARLREVGTTNKTRLSDYQEAIGPETAALLRVHASNYRIVGFTESVSVAELSALARSRGLSLIDDIGSGALRAGCPPVPADEPTLVAGLRQGADVVLCSGDKLLGGPQCGLIVGRRSVVDRIERDPLMRAFRVDKLTLSALEATLGLMLDADLARETIPLWKALSTPVEALKIRAIRLCNRLREVRGLSVEVEESTAFVGGGSVPADALPSYSVRIDPPWPAPIVSADVLHQGLRMGDPSVVGRLHAGSLWLDLRTVPEADDDRLFRAVASVISPEDLPS